MRKFTAVAVVMMLTASIAGASVISVNLHHGQEITQGSAGIVDVAHDNWNELNTGGTSSATVSNPIDETGTSITGASVTVESRTDAGGAGSPFIGYNFSDGTATGNAELARDACTGEGNDNILVTVTGLSGDFEDKGYSVYLYLFSNDGTSGGGAARYGGPYEVDIDTSSDTYHGIVGAETGNASQQSDWDYTNQATNSSDAGNVTALKIDVDAGTTGFVLEVNGTYKRTMLEGIQIDSVPEPATMSLLALGGLGVLIRRRRS
jgi:hypothetical protein